MLINKLVKYGSFLLVAMLIVGAGLWWQITQSINTPLKLAESEQLELVTIKPGDTMHKFSKTLVKRGFIDSRFWLRNYARLYPRRVALKTGTYQVFADDTLASLIDRIGSGKEYQQTITFVEGSTIKDWLIQVANETNIKKTQATQDIASLVKALKMSELHPEGWFFPDTYAFTLGTPDVEIFKRAHQKMMQELERLWQARALDLPYQSPYEALIMASIIEKETGQLAEQPRIASVFVNRLRKKMRLQTDPTVIYGLGERYQGDITRAHLKEKTAYNTYRINGLPPTPIAMPSLKAIYAALHPEQSDYLYFVSKGNGSHYFSKTLAEHNQAVRKYQLGKS